MGLLDRLLRRHREDAAPAAHGGADAPADAPTGEWQGARWGWGDDESPAPEERRRPGATAYLGVDQFHGGIGGGGL